MKKYLKNALIGSLLGLLIIPIMLIELYYWGGYEAYLSEVVYFNSFLNTTISTMVFGGLIGILITFSGFVKKVKYINEDVKNVLHIVIITVLVSIMLYVTSCFNLSETVDTLTTFNTVVILIVLMISVLVYNSIQVKKINKKIKE